MSDFNQQFKDLMASVVKLKHHEPEMEEETCRICDREILVPKYRENDEGNYCDSCAE